MLDGLTLDQFAVFVTVVEEGSGMPRHLVAEDLAQGRLVALTLDQASAGELPPAVPLSLVYLRTKALGLAGRWLMERLIEHAPSKS